jgi:spermidine synthase
MLALVAAGESRDELRPPCKILRERFGELQGWTRYYTPEVHRAAFTLAPSFEPSCLREHPMSAGFLETGS